MPVPDCKRGPPGAETGLADATGCETTDLPTFSIPSMALLHGSRSPVVSARPAGGCLNQN